MIRLLYKVSTRVFLVLATLIAMLPFLDLRVLRMAGDEKVYVTQSIEMARDGRWFAQTLADEPSYFKGPLHYVLTRIGMLGFGDRLIAGTWMNLVFALLAGLAMHRLGRKRWNDKTALLLGLATALNVGVFSHAFVSQMEVEVMAFYAFAVAALGLSRGKDDFKHDLLFWISAGAAGWSKSPLHSALIGLGGILYWTLTGQLAAKARSPKAWGAVLAGVAVGVIGYLPAFFFDRQNFVATYLGREQFEKANNNRSWSYVMSPLLHFALPWTVVIAAGLIKGIRALRESARARAERVSMDLDMVKLGAAMCLPTMLFWCVWTYKGQNYNLPTMPAMLLFGFAFFQGSAPRWAYQVVGAIGAVTLMLVLSLFAHFWPLPEWWSMGWVLLAVVDMTAFAAIFLVADDPRALAAGAVAFFLAFGALITPLGEREMIDIHRYIAEHPELTYHYDNLKGECESIWNEWALLQLVTHHKILGLHRESMIPQAMSPGHVIIAQNEDRLSRMLTYWKNHKGQNGITTKEPIVTPWSRWLTKGTTPEGVKKWKPAWDLRDLSQLERKFYILRFE